VVVLVVLSTAVIDAGSGLIWRARDPRPEDVREIARHATPLNLGTPYAPADYAFLDQAIGSRSIVQLASHFTSRKSFRASAFGSSSISMSNSASTRWRSRVR
jgi:hypothetical protein